MRYVSEQFKEKQNQLIRPPLSLYFEVCSDIKNDIYVPQMPTYPLFDTSVAPVILPKDCSNEYYYAVLGDGIGVDDPNRMCAPDNSGAIATPTHSVPTGITTVVPANTEVMLGSDTFYYDFIGISSDSTFSFKGGVIPEEIRVEKYDVATSTWTTEQVINNPDLSEEIFYPFSVYFDKYHRFYLKNKTKSGRYQFNWLKREWATYKNAPPVVFRDSKITSVSVDEETDLTSQDSPRYEMTVTCLDVEGKYSPDSEYWENNKQFTDRKECYLSAGYKTENNEIELVPLFMGLLTQKPAYDQGKITFNISAWAINSRQFINVSSQPNATLNVGDEVDSAKISSKFSNLFTSYDVFHGAADENNTVSNQYQYCQGHEARKLLANAVGGYITLDFGEVNLHNTCDIQYKSVNDYLTRYEQVKCSLESQPKAGNMQLTRNLNTLSADYVDIEAAERVSLPAYSFVSTTYKLPFYAFGKATVVDYQSSVSGLSLGVRTYNPETQMPNGDLEVYISISNASSTATTIKPIMRFYRVDNTKYEETETVDSQGSETYVNDNDFVTNSYTADKVKRVARFMSDVSNQYEVDVVQDLRYEIGDVIRLETEKNVYKTCVITALKFNLPGSTGHVTCRKIFNIADSNYALFDVDNAKIISYEGETDGGITVLEAVNNTCVVGIVKNRLDNDRLYYIILGATKLKDYHDGGSSTIIKPNVVVTDNNNHDWYFRVLLVSGTTYDFTPVTLDDYDSGSPVNNGAAYGAMQLVIKLYGEQGMTSPVDYDCTYQIIT